MKGRCVIGIIGGEGRHLYMGPRPHPLSLSRSIPLALAWAWLSSSSAFAALVPTYGTYFGGTGDSNIAVAVAVAVDPQGNVIVAGYTTSQTLPGTANAFQPTKAPGFPDNQNVFIAKFDPTGRTLLWTTFLGGDTLDIKWTPLSEPFFVRNKLMLGGVLGSSLGRRVRPPLAIPALESALGSHPCGALSSVQVLSV